MYSEVLLEHFRNPRNVGEVPSASATVETENPACGDTLRLSARMESGVVVQAGYLARGCTASVAAGSALTEWMRGKTPAELAGLTARAMEDALGGLPGESKHAAALCVQAVRALVRQLK